MNPVMSPASKRRISPNFSLFPGWSAALTAIPFLLLTPVASALTIISNGDVVNIDESTPLDDYSITGSGSTLKASGANLAYVTLVSGGIFNMNGGTVNAGDIGPAIELASSSATVNNATVFSNEIGLSAGREVGNEGSRVQVTGSTIEGGEIGARVTGLSTLQLNSSRLVGSGANGIGLRVQGGNVLASNASAISGANHGVVFARDTPDAFGDYRLTLDNSSVTGTAGAAIQVAQGVTGNIEVLNGSTLNGGNGNLLQVERNATANMRVAGSALTGNVQVAQGGNASLAFDRAQLNGNVAVAEGANGTLSLQNGSSLTGTVTGIGTLALNASSLTGDVSMANAGSVVLGNHSVLEGDVIGSNNVRLDGSSMTGNITSASTAGLIALAQGSTLEGNVAGSDRVTLDASLLKGDVVSASALGEVSLGDGSAINGNVNSNHLSLDASFLTGDITSIDAASAVSLRRNSVVTGNVSSNAVSLDSSSLTGDITSIDGTGTVSLQDSILAGNVSSNAVSLDASSLTGDITSIDGSGTVSLQDSILAGNVSSNTVSLDASSLTGDITSIDGRGTVSLQDSVLAGNVNSNTVSLDASSLTGDITSIDRSGTVSLQDSVLAGNVNSNTVNLDASSLTGNITSIDGTGVVSLQHDSTFTGNLINVDSVIIGDPSVWNMVGNNTVNSLTMSDGVVKFGATNEFYQLNVGNLSGNGTFVMDADFATNQHDLLNVTGSATGSHTLLIAGAGVDPVSPEALTFVHTAGGDATFALAGGRAVDVGTYSYELASSANASGGSDWFLDPGTKTISPGTASVLALFNTAPTVWYGELTSLRSRMGELRFNGGKAGGWVRTYGNKYNVSESSGVGYQQTQQGFSLGADAPLPVGDGQWLVGVLAGHSTSDLNLDHGTSGTVKSYYAGLYATWMDQASGYYFDGVIKANRFRNDSKVSISDGTRAKGDYDNTGVGGSVEFGRHIKLDDGYFVEPFGQLSSVVIQGKDYFLNNEMHAQGDRTRSLLGKVGVTAGRNFALSDGKVVQPYVRMAGVHEFAKNNEVQVNNNVFNNDLSGSRGELGAGVAVAFSDNLQLHADFDYGSGKHIEQPFGANVGLRYSW